MKLNIKHFLYTALLSSYFSTSLPAQSIITDRPDQTESSSTIPKNSLQLETGVLFGHAGFNPNREKHLLAPATLLRFGLLKNLELRVANQFARASSEGVRLENFGFSDIEFGTKVQLLRNENVNTEIAFLSHFIIPIGDKRLTNTDFGVVNKFSIAHNLSPKIGLGYNVGYNYFGVGKGVATYSVALGFDITQKLGFYIEPYGEFVDLEMHVANLDGGFTYLVGNQIQLDISYGIGLNYHMHYVATGFSWNFFL